MPFSDILQNSSFNFDPLGTFTGLVGVGVNAFQNSKNLQFQREAYEYQKWLNNQIMLREDTAVQRRMEDLKKAGLSPYLAVGSSAQTGSYTGGSAPMSNFQMPQFNSQFKLMSKMELAQMKAQTDYIEAQADIERNKAKAVSDNPFLLFQDNFFSRLSALREVFPNLSGQLEKFLELADGAFQSPKDLSLNGLIDYAKTQEEKKELKKQQERFNTDSSNNSKGYQMWLNAVSGMDKNARNRLTFDEFNSLNTLQQDLYTQYSQSENFYKSKEWKEIKNDINRMYTDNGLKKRF